jgi:SOS-response transcriptional repressor LexA
MTPRQADIMRLLIDAEGRGPIAPSYGEMMKAIGVKSKSRISELANQLRCLGYITTMPDLYRSARTTPAGRAAFAPIGLDLSLVSDEDLHNEIKRRDAVILPVTDEEKSNRNARSV